MTPEHWQHVKKMLAAALEREPAKRAAYLDQVCAEPSLRRELESLIAAHEQGDNSFMEHPAVQNGVLRNGTKLGSYEILAPIGAGGMGEVYKAHDSKLRRDVAIKVLPSAFVNDPERLSRFQREARMLASLNHPNIATIHGLEQSDGVHYLVMELVPRRDAGRANQQGPIASGGGAESSESDRGSTGGGARKRSDPSGLKTCQRESDARRPGEGAGFWFGKGICQRRQKTFRKPTLRRSPAKKEEY